MKVVPRVLCQFVYELWEGCVVSAVEGGLIRRLNLNLTLAKHQPNPIASEYLSNLQSPIVLSTSTGSMLTTLLSLHPLPVFAGVREGTLELVTWAVELGMAKAFA